LPSPEHRAGARDDLVEHTGCDDDVVIGEVVPGRSVSAVIVVCMAAIRLRPAEELTSLSPREAGG
jgi:hypothetical protein